MKFLCISCDTQMKLEETTGPVEGSLSVSFACPSCAHRIALLTNPGETQLVRALDVKIGGRSSPVEPWEFVRSMLAAKREGALEGTGDVAAREEGSTPSTEPSSRDFGEPFDALRAEPLSRDAQAEGLGAGPRCPFSAVANRAADAASLTWDPSAEERLERVPDFIRPMARQGIERFAAERGYTRITEEVIDEVRGTLGF
ncbi:MAG: PCP reductase family protein [Candidatus Methylomirabilales bacterium]